LEILAGIDSGVADQVNGLIFVGGGQISLNMWRRSNPAR
jgi:hypothetical protein